MGTVQILVVEHQRREAGDLRRRLERLGYGVASVAATGRQAVEKARRSSPDLALMEIGLKGEPTGLEAAEEIRSRLGIPVIFLTDDAGPDALARANITEPFGYVVKPVQDRELQLCIEAALQKHKADALDQAQKAMARDRDLLHALMDNIPDAIYFKDAESRFLRVNKAHARRLGVGGPDEAVGRRDADFYADAFARLAYADEQEVVKSGRPMTDKVEQVVRPSGETVWVSATKAPVLDAEGHVAGIVGISRDITERKQAEEALRQTHQTLEALVNSAPLAICTTDSEGHVTMWNPAAERIFGWTREEVLGRILPSVPTDKLDEFAALRKRVLNGEALTGVELHRQRKDGTPIDISLSTAPLYDAEGKTTGILGIQADITEHKRAEEELRESEERYRGLVEQSLMGIGLSRGNRVVFANPALLRMFGYDDLEEFATVPLLDHVSPSFRDRIAARLRMAAQGKTLEADFEYDIVRKDGEIKTLHAFLTHIRLGGEIYTQAVFQDITEQKRAEQALRESKELLEKTFLSQRDAIFILDAQTPPAVVDCNPAASEVFGYVREEMLGRTTCFLHVDEKTLREFQEIVYPAVEEQGFIHLAEFRMKRQDGTVFPTEHTVAPLTDELGNRIGWVSVIRDITERKRAEEALRESEERFRLAFENANIGMCLVNTEGRLVRVNSMMCEIFGYGRDELEGMTVNDIAHPEDLDVSPAFIRRAMSGEIEHTRFEKRYFHKDGHVVWGQVSSSLVRDIRGDPLCFISHLQDITERKRAEETLRESEERYRHIFEHSPMGIGIASPEGKVIAANRAMQAITGYSAEEIKQINLADTYENEEDRKALFEALSRSGSAADLSVRLKRKDGSPYDALLNVSRIHLGGKDCLHTICQDITERKRAEQALRQSEARFQELFDDAPVGYHELDTEGRITSVNRTELAMLGYTSGEMLGRAVWDFPADPETSQRAFRAKIAGTLPPGQAFERTFRRNDGRELPVLVSERLLRDPAGQIVGLRITNQDISERKRADEALREAMLRFELVIEKNPLVAIQGIDRSGAILHWNVASEWLYGYCAAEVIGKRLQDHILPPEEIAGFEQDLALIWESGEPTPPQEWPVRNRKGDLLWVYSTLFPIFEKGRVVEVFCMDVDVTQRRRAEEAEHHSRRVTEAVAAASLQYLETRDVQTMTQVIADRAAEITGAALGIVIDLDAQRQARIRAASAATWGILDGSAYRQAHRELDEKGFYSLASFGDNLVLAPLRDGASLLTNSPPDHPRWAGTMPAWHPAIESFLGVPIKTGGEVLGMIALANRPGGFTERELHDVETFAKTAALGLRMARSEEERARAEEQLHQAMKMEAIGRLAGGIAHDFNNLLTAIMGYAELGFNMLHPAERVRHYFEEIQQAADRASKLTRQLLTFSRRQQVQPRVINLNEIISDMGKMLSRLIGEDIELATRPADNVWSVRIDPSQIEQVLVNLAVNARDAMPHGGRLTVETTNVHLDEEEARLYAGVSPGDYVLLAVSDTGTGMTDEIKSHLFEPFFTTKEVGKGTGLGLATCYGIVQQSGGWIRVYSEAGQGTIFKIYLPRVPETAAELPSRDQAGFLPRGAETILLVEDESLVRSLAATILRNQGYTVLEAADGDEALRVVHDDPDRPIHLLMTDVVMPRMGGKALADRLRAVQPQLRVLFASGYSEGSIYDLGISEPGAGFLQKPFSPGGLARKVREVLDWPRVERRE